ncbi:FAD-dependent monooxygenase [Mycobacterium asiaticum]|uniref:FAD-dependent monooxygenase n=1 Tax=Mycobacterium asiaticum TaxID=1790 RepID=UPI000A716E58|nr:FAD-dependent monooxygenase [Mycobacterium asiaticum]
MTLKVAVCGAGIAGLAVAERMAALGAEVVVLERAPGPDPRGHLIDFYGAGYEAVDAIGALPALKDASYRIDEATLVDEQGRRRGDLPYDQIAKALDGRMCSLTRSDLEKTLRDNLPEDVELRFGATVTGVDSRADGVTVTLDGGETIEADLLVGADGIRSAVRKLVFGTESAALRYLGFHCVAFVVDASDIARESDVEQFAVTDTIDRHLDLFFLPDGRAAVFAMFRAPDAELGADPRAEIRERFADMGWLVPEILRRCPPSEDIYYEAVTQVVMPRWSSNRVVLIGDAGAAVSPFAAHSASLAVAGAYVLAEQFRTTSSVERALDFYEKLWRWVVEEKQQISRDIGCWTLPGRSRPVSLRFTWRPLVKRFITTTLGGEPNTVVAMLRRGTSEPDN